MLIKKLPNALDYVTVIVKISIFCEYEPLENKEILNKFVTEHDFNYQHESVSLQIVFRF